MLLPFVLPDVSPVSLQMDLDRRLQLHDITMDFKVCFLEMVRDKRVVLSSVGLGHGGAVFLSSQAGSDSTKCWVAPSPGLEAFTTSLYHGGNRGLALERSCTARISSWSCQDCISPSSLYPLSLTHRINSALPSADSAGPSYLLSTCVF